jgi:hypothetical protein
MDRIQNLGCAVAILHRPPVRRPRAAKTGEIGAIKSHSGRSGRFNSGHRPGMIPAIRLIPIYWWLHPIFKMDSITTCSDFSTPFVIGYENIF